MRADLAGGARRGLRFLTRYGYAAGSALYLFTLGVRKGRNRHLISRIAEHFGYGVGGGGIPEVPLAALVPEEGEIELREPLAVDGNVSLFELVAISKLVRHLRPRRILEIGTFDGRTTLNLAANAPPAARVFTLDLPRESLADPRLAVRLSERVFIEKPESGVRFRGTDCAARITQLFGDSASFDFAPYRGTMAFVFVDGSHAYEYVLSDSRIALELLRTEGGTVLWHDYGVWDDVTRALEELHGLGGAFAGLRRIAGSSLVILRAGGVAGAGAGAGGSSETGALDS